MARETIYENPNVAFSGGEGMVTNLLLIPGETYQIVWDDVECTATASTESFNGMTVVAIGDLGIAAGSPTGEYPFLIGALPDGSAGYAFSVEYETPSHSLAIYREVEIPVNGETIVLKDRDGKKNHYNPPNGVRFEMGDGNTQLFVSAADLPKSVSVTVDPDFTGNKNMTVVPENGTQFSEVIVKKPELLIPANIASGVTIAGILGELVGGAELKIASGSLKPFMNGMVSVSHNLGVIPNIIFVYATITVSSTTTSYLKNAVGLRIPGMAKFIIGGSMGVEKAFTYTAVDITNQDDRPISRATEKSFYFGTTTSGLYPAIAPSSQAPSGYSWYAIGGLD